jgi:predicted MPP superfamily phosphohydrolase
VDGGTTDRRHAERPRRLVVAVAVLGLVPGAVGWHTTRVAPHDLRVDEVTLEVPDAAGGDVVRIGVLADLQTERVTDYERRAVATLADERPDVVLVAGDLFQGSDTAFAEDRDELVALLSSLEAPGGVFVVTGDVDRRDRLARLAADAGITHLDDRTTEVEVGDRRLRITGVPLRHRRGSEALDRLEPADDGTISILVAHRPDWVLVADPATIDLVVAGHTHGGQVQLPWIGPLVTHSAVPRHVAAGGLHEVRGIPTYVSTGVGHQQQGAPQVRFLARPSVGVVELTG